MKYLLLKRTVGLWRFKKWQDIRLFLGMCCYSFSWYFLSWSYHDTFASWQFRSSDAAKTFIDSIKCYENINNYLFTFLIDFFFCNWWAVNTILRHTKTTHVSSKGNWFHTQNEVVWKQYIDKDKHQGTQADRHRQWTYVASLLWGPMIMAGLCKLRTSCVTSLYKGG